MQFGQKGILKLAKRPSSCNNVLANLDSGAAKPTFGETFRGVGFGYVNDTLCEQVVWVYEVQCS